METENFLQELELTENILRELKNNKVLIENLDSRYLIRFQWRSEAKVENILKLLNENIYSFKEIVDRFKSIRGALNDSWLYKLLYNEEFSKELIQNNKLNKDDLRYLLNEIDEEIELWGVCGNTPLIKYILNEFVLNKETVNRFNTIIENDEMCKEENIYTLFKLIKYCNKNNEEILNLIKLNKKVSKLLNNFDLNEDQRLELIEVLKDNEIAQNRLIQIVDNQLESQYDFESLMKYLNKEEKKNLLNI